MFGDNYLGLQLLSSFLVGGAFISLQSLLAEKSREEVAGIILMFPSTVVLGFFFLALSNSPESVSQIVPSTFIPLGIVIMSSVIYIYFAQVFERLTFSRTMQVFLSFCSASLCWFLLAFPFAFFKVNTLWIGFAGYLLLAFLAHRLLNKRVLEKKPERPHYTRGQGLFRACFIGSVVTTVVLVGKTQGPFWGGLFIMYPAATFSTLLILHHNYAPSQLFFFYRRAPLGSLSVALYCLGVMAFYPYLGIVVGTLVSLLLCLGLSYSLVKLQEKLEP